MKLNFENICKFLKISSRSIDHSRRDRYPNVGEEWYTRVKLSITTNELRSPCKTNYSHLRTILISFLGETRVVRISTLHTTRMQQPMYTRRCHCSLEIGGQWISLLRCWYHERFDTAITRKFYRNTLVTTKQRNREWRVLKVKICYFQRTVGIFCKWSLINFTIFFLWR